MYRKSAQIVRTELLTSALSNSAGTSGVIAGGKNAWRRAAWVTL
jgi:hypothetical protein